MRKFYKLFIFPIFICSNALLAQAPQGIEELKLKYEEFFEMNRENVFLHLNKTAVIPEEDIWLSAYIYNSRFDAPNIQTANLDVKIYKKNGEHLDTKTLYINKGKGTGYIELDAEKYPPGDYYLKATTNYMLNFPEDLSYIQSFKILAGEANAPKKQDSYDLQLLPEGGHLLSASLNAVGVKMIDQTGAGSAFINGVLMDSKGREITRFKSNRNGLSKFSFIPLQGESYEAVIESETGIKVRHKLPFAKENGINIINTVKDDEHLFSIRTNEATHPQIKGKRFFLAVHREGNIKELNFEFPVDQKELNIVMKKDSLFPGVNTVTLFDENLNPLAERLIFNENNIKRSSIKATNQGRLRDSTWVGLQAGPNAASTSLSISVLPLETEAYDPDHNIISAFHLKPHVQGYIDEPGFYFSSGDEVRKDYHLDLLLLSQGWSKYEWKDIFENSINEDYEQIIGYSLEGQINSRNEKRHKNIMIRSDNSGILEIAEIQPDGRFKRDRIFLVENAELDFSLVNDRSSKMSVPSMTVSVFPKKEMENLNKEFSFPERKEYKEIAEIPEAFSQTEYQLDTVDIKTKKYTDPVFDPDLQIQARGFKITEEIAEQYNHIVDYIATKGFLITHVNGWVEIKSTSISTLRGGGSGSPQTRSRGAQSNVLIYLNGVPMGTDASFLTGLPTAQVESIVVNKHGLGYGVGASNGVIKITTKKGGFDYNSRETVKTFFADNGYNLNKEFYVPRYKVFNNTAFLKYGVVDWKPSVLLDEEGKAEFLISKKGAVSLFIEGMNEQGVLISEILTLE